MIKNKVIPKVLIFLLLTFVIFCVVTHLLSNRLSGSLYLWIIFAAECWAFLASCFMLLLGDNRKRIETEVKQIPVYVILMYFLSSTAFTFIYFLIMEFMVLPTFRLFLAVIFAVHAVLFTVTVLVWVSARNYGERLSMQEETYTNKAQWIHRIATELGSLISLANEPGIKSELLKLKETVSYSSNLGQGFNQRNEEMFLQKILKIQEMLLNNERVEDIMQRIEEAKGLWNLRNNLSASIR